ncbi:MAG: cysteine desulfurase-like protein [Saprospiraceae bacterium]|jgi:cysteine desulfurase family protein (TIGR01976 family)
MNAGLRSKFPALSRTENGKPLIYMDGPAGVQVPQSVIDAVSGYYSRSNANTHGAFLTSRETDATMDHARLRMAEFLGAEGPECVSFGQNMTTLNFMLSRAIARVLQPGDEILITQLDHEGNRGPWLSLRERGIVVREVRLLPEGVLDYEDFAQKINERTRLVAMGYSSNILGTVNDIALVRKLSHAAGAWLLIDAVHAAPHFSLDVQAIGCDFLLCSAYKFYGPHVGILYSRPGLLDRLQPDRLRTAYQHAPYSIETGTLNHAAIAGVGAAVDFIATLGEGETTREQLVSAMHLLQRHEWELGAHLYNGLAQLPGVVVHGVPFTTVLRAPTLSLSVAGLRAEELCTRLARENVFAWDGHFYAIRATEVLGLLEQGGVTRLGISAYTTREEVDTVLQVVEAVI